MKLRIFSLIALIIGVLLLIVGIAAPALYLKTYTSGNGTAGIIGGSDMPTYDFVDHMIMHGWPVSLRSFAAALILTALFCLILRKTVQSSCCIQTTLVALSLSVVGAMGLTCFLNWWAIAAFNEISRYPIEYQCSILIGLTCFLIFIVLIALYLAVRKKHWSVKGFIIDIFTSIIYVPAFFFCFSFLHSVMFD